MIQLCLVLLGLSVGIICDSRDFVPFFGREAKSLTDAFPFSLQEDDHQHHGHDVQEDNDVGFERGSRQVNRNNKTGGKPQFVFAE